MLILLMLYVMSIICYFYVLRKMISNGLDFDFEKFMPVFFLLLIGLIPVVNIAFIAVVVIDYIVWTSNLTPNEILRKILFLEVEKDRRDI